MRGKGNRAVLPELESRLTVAAAGQVKESKGSGRRLAGTKVLAIGAACLAFTGTAIAATGVWDPGIGSESPSGPATVSSTPVPAEITDALGVLASEPTAEDRNAAVEATLRQVSPGDGVRPESARYLGEGHDGAIVLVSGETAGGSVSLAAPHTEEGVCVAQPFFEGPIGPALACFTLPQVLAGDALAGFAEVGADRQAMIGLVPDGVASVTLEFGSAPDHTVPVEDNYFSASLSGAEMSNANGEAGIQNTVWHDADGQVIPQR